MATVNKSQRKFQPPDWFTNSFMMSANSVRQRQASHDIRQETRALRLSAALRAKWDNYYNTTRLADRLDTVISFKDILELAKSKLDEEIAKLSAGKDALEKQIADMQIPEDCNVECLTLRDRRRGVDFNEDKPEYELKAEQELLAKCKKRLQQKVDEAYDQLLLLQEVRQQVLKDLQDKNETIDIDIEQYKLVPSCPGVSYKVNPTRVPKGTTTLKQWEDFTRYNWQRTEAEIGASERLREAIFYVMHQTENELEAQARATDFALRKRSHEDKAALDELNWQRKQTEDEIAEMLNDLEKLEQELMDQIPPTKVAQTRLERRTYRPGVDLCRDGPQYGLTDEVKQLESTRQALLMKQHEARHQLDALERQLNRLKDDIALKERSLRLDSDCLELRRERMGGSGKLEDKQLDCKKLLAEQATGDEIVCQEKEVEGVPTYSLLDRKAAACAVISPRSSCCT
uniref:Tektin n=1 Tax=Schistocephalus solidus TaxID=70667 RepID=A0A0X3PMV0_SCHSO